MVTLADLGFCQNIICEAIICTFNLDGRPNAAPMGATIKNSQEIILTIYNSAETLKNLQITKSATLNLTGNIDFYYKSTLKDDGLPADWFKKSDTVNAPKLKAADATVSLSIKDFEPVDEIRTRVTCYVKHVEALKVYPQTYCRAMPAVLEAIIHATRIKALISVEAEQEHVAKLYSLIQNCIDVVNRSAPNSHYTELMTDLQKKIDLLRGGLKT
ncbi:MAG: DUF447 family protein [Candidatus Bathyarchaeota archaeon]|nr:DUF447 family protein [Candidatus Termiticorpusculum sp.]